MIVKLYTFRPKLCRKVLAYIRASHNRPRYLRDREAATTIKSYYSWGVLFNPCALWVGGHFNPVHKRWCLNLIPTFTIWLKFPGGNEP